MPLGPTRMGRQDPGRRPSRAARSARSDRPGSGVRWRCRMRFHRLARALALVALVATAFGIGRGSAQSVLPDGVFVKDSGGTIWLIIGGQRAKVPFYPAG